MKANSNWSTPKLLSNYRYTVEQFQLYQVGANMITMGFNACGMQMLVDNFNNEIYIVLRKYNYFLYNKQVYVLDLYAQTNNHLNYILMVQAYPIQQN